jgi:acetyl-CoA carboxylase biotin carboxyl carrier protein
MDFNQIQEIIKLVSETGLREFNLEDKDFKLSIRSKDYVSQPETITETKIVTIPAASGPMPSYPMPQYAAPQAPMQVAAAPVSAPAAPAAPAAQPAAEEATGNYIEITSPIVGTFYRSSTPEKGPYIKVGDKVSANSVVCIVEAMKLFNEIEAEVSGTIVKVLIEDATPVEYGQPLFLVDPS